MRPAKTNLVDEVYNGIRRAAGEGRIKEGDKLPTETKLAEQYSVRRSVVREALQRLRAENCIVTKQGFGSLWANPNNFSITPDGNIPDLSVDELREFRYFREAYDRTALELAARRRTEEDLEALETELRNMEEAEEGSPEFTAADTRFHYHIFLAAKNHYLPDAFESNATLIQKYMMYSNSIVDSKQYAMAYHRSLLEAIRDGRARDGVRVLEQHEQYTLMRWQRLFDMKGEESI